MTAAGAMDYVQARDWLDSLGEFHMAFGLDRVEEVLRRLGDPHRAAPVIHVAGTNGKGATCAFASGILRAAGIKVGLYTSPHLSRPNERIAIDGMPIVDEAFARVVTAVREAAESPVAPQIELTFFEVLTVAAFVAFREAAVNVMVIEVGLGGRLDATNVVEPAVSVVTALSRDHMQILGDSMEAIATEKAAIVKAGHPAICAARDPAAAAVVGARAREVGATYFKIGRELQITGGAERDGGAFAIETYPPAPSMHVSGCRIAALGAHLRDDAGAAALAVKVLYPALETTVLAAGIAQAAWPGRGERIAMSAPHPFELVLDGAHNPGAVDALVRALQDLGPARTAFVFASMKDKEHLPILEALAGLLPVSMHVVSLGMSRSADPSELAALAAPIFAARGAGPVVPVAETKGALVSGAASALADARRALAEAAALAGPNGRVVVTGSLYLVGRVREALMGPPERIG